MSLWICTNCGTLYGPEFSPCQCGGDVVLAKAEIETHAPVQATAAGYSDWYVEELRAKNAKLRALLSECKERLWLVNNTLGVCNEYLIELPKKLSDVIDDHLKQNLELQNKIEEVLE